MTYQDIINDSSYFNNLSSNFINNYGASVLVYALDKKATKLHPIYCSELSPGRVYLRPFEMKCIYKTDPFNFSFDGTIPSETDGGPLMFNFSFNSMVQTIHELKDACSHFTIVPKNNTDEWNVEKQGEILKIYRANKILTQADTNEYVYELNTHSLLSLKTAIESTNKFTVSFDTDDFASAIPSFKKVKMYGSGITLKTRNPEFKNIGDVIEEGFLIYIEPINALYEVNAAYPSGNISGYQFWTCKATRTFAYVNYERLKSYKYGLGVNQADTIELAK